MEDLEPFYPDRMAGRILGMGDVLSFVEKAQEVVSFQENYNQNFLPLSLTEVCLHLCRYRCVKKMLKIYRRR